MALQVDPARLTSQPLLLHQREPGEYWVVVAGFIAGRVSRYEAPDGGPLWLWYLTGPIDKEERKADCGDGRSLLDAKEALRASLQIHIDAAVLMNKTITWND